MLLPPLRSSGRSHSLSEPSRCFGASCFRAPKSPRPSLTFGSSSAPRSCPWSPSTDVTRRRTTVPGLRSEFCGAYIHFLLMFQMSHSPCQLFFHPSSPTGTSRFCPGCCNFNLSSHLAHPPVHLPLFIPCFVSLPKCCILGRLMTTGFPSSIIISLSPSLAFRL